MPIFAANATCAGVPDWLGDNARAQIWPVVLRCDADSVEQPDFAANAFARIFGNFEPQRCARVPTFGGFYRPDQHGSLSSAQVDSASKVRRLSLGSVLLCSRQQVLVALALDNTDIVFAPQLPDLVVRQAAQYCRGRSPCRLRSCCCCVI